MPPSSKLSSSETLGSFLLQVRGGSDYRYDGNNYGDYRDPYYRNDDRRTPSPRKEDGYYDEFYDQPESPRRSRPGYDNYDDIDDRRTPSPVSAEEKNNRKRKHSFLNLEIFSVG
jgi:hypothetical protein